MKVSNPGKLGRSSAGCSSCKGHNDPLKSSPQTAEAASPHVVGARPALGPDGCSETPVVQAARAQTCGKKVQHFLTLLTSLTVE